MDGVTMDPISDERLKALAESGECDCRVCYGDCQRGLARELLALRSQRAAGGEPEAWLLRFDSSITGGAPATALVRHGEGLAEWAQRLPGSIPLYASPAPALVAGGEADYRRLAGIVAHIGALATTARDAGKALDPIGVLGVIEHEPAPAPVAPNECDRCHGTGVAPCPNVWVEPGCGPHCRECGGNGVVACCRVSPPAPAARRTNLLTALWNAACAVGCEEDGEIILARALRAIEDEYGSIEACLGAQPAPAPVARPRPREVKRD